MYSPHLLYPVWGAAVIKIKKRQFLYALCMFIFLIYSAVEGLPTWILEFTSVSQRLGYLGKARKTGPLPLPHFSAVGLPAVRSVVTLSPRRGVVTEKQRPLNASGRNSNRGCYVIIDSPDKH